MVTAPPRNLPAMLVDWVAERRLAWRVRRDTTPPPPHRFGSFGDRSVVVPPARISEPSSIHIGDDVVIHEGSWLSVVRAHPATTPRLVLGDRARLGRGLSIACIGEIVFEADVSCSDDVFVADCYHDYADPATPVLYQPMSRPQRVVIGAGAFLGAGCAVLHGVTIGPGAYVGEGSVVTMDVPAGGHVRGNPATIVGRRQ